MTEITDTRFTPGTFTPAPKRAPRSRMVAAQGRMETILFLRHGEQQLLSIIIPLAMLVIAARIPLLGEDRGVAEIFPMMLAIATTSSGFTGQAIALAFDRRYGALKRTGASGVPAATIIAGKVIAVTVMAALQAVLLGGTAIRGLLDTQVGVTRMQGQWTRYDGIPVMPTYHPAYILRFESLGDAAGLKRAKTEVWHALKLVLAQLGVDAQQVAELGRAPGRVVGELGAQRLVLVDDLPQLLGRGHLVA